MGNMNQSQQDSQKNKQQRQGQDWDSTKEFSSDKANRNDYEGVDPEQPDVQANKKGTDAGSSSTKPSSSATTRQAPGDKI